jgi:two-component system chemotaxis response regulator CheY
MDRGNLMKLLIVDDDHKNRKVLTAMVDELGECEVVDSGKKAVSAFIKAWESWRPFDLILLDIYMPEIDGTHVLRKIREIEIEKNISETHHVKIIMVTALSEKKMVLECMRDGCDDYIVKPIDGRSLFEKIKKLGLINSNPYVEF